MPLKEYIIRCYITVEMHHYNPINIADLNESECMAQYCYSENTGGVEQTGCDRETKKENTETEREKERRQMEQ